MPASRIGVIGQASHDGIGTELILRILNSVEMSENLIKPKENHDS